jgi:hypothetical protein
MKLIFTKKKLNPSPFSISKLNNLEGSKHQNFDTLKLNSRLDKLIDSPISGKDLINN